LAVHHPKFCNLNPAIKISTSNKFHQKKNSHRKGIVILSAVKDLLFSAAEHNPFGSARVDAFGLDV
jgi:hypothetical protein